jgi:integrase/recombinase XerD
MQSTNTTSELEDLQQQFLVERRFLQNIKPRTLALYAETFDKFTLTLADFNNPRLLTTAALQLPATLKPITARLHLVRLSTFARWLHERGVTGFKPQLKLRPLKPQPSSLPTLAELQKLYAALDAHVATATPARRRAARNHRLMVHLLIATGIRIGECLSLTTIDLNADDRSPSITVRAGKTRAAERTIRLNTQLAHELGDHCARQSGTLIFQSPRGARLNRNAFLLWLHPFARAAGLHTTITPHVLRHYFIIRSAIDGKSLFDVMTELGHSTPRQTIYYFNRARRLYPAARPNPDVGFIEKGET